MKRLPLFAFLLLLSSSAFAQFPSLQLVSSDPADGTAGVALDATVSFTFDTDLRTLGIEDPYDVVGLINEVETEPEGTISADGRTATFTFQHEPDTDYIWAVASIRPGQGPTDFAFATFVHYTTAATIGQNTISGTVEVSPEVEGNILLGSTILYLSAVNPFETDELVILSAAIAETSGSWSIPYVRPGTYYLLGLNAALGEEDEEIFLSSLLIGIYDTNGDGIIDPFSVNSDVGGLTVTLQPGLGGLDAAQGFGPARARAEAEATAVLGSVPADLELVGIEGAGGLLFGSGSRTEILGFNYYFYTATTDDLFIVTPTLFGTEIEVDTDPFLDVTPTALPVPTTDTEVILQAALDEGGQAFLDQEQTGFFALIAGDVAIDFAADLESIIDGELPTPPEGPYWLALFQSIDFTTFEFKVFAVYLDYNSGEVLGQFGQGFAVSNEEEATLPTAAILHPSYPNPFNPQTTIPFSLQQAGPVQVTVHNALGQQVAVLAEDWMAAGEHRQVWTADTLPSGTYFVRLAVGGTVQTQAVILQK